MTKEATYEYLIRCPSQPEGISFPAHWYRFCGIDNFWICSKCHRDDISSTSLATLCEQFHDNPLPGSTSFCDFNNARTKQLLQTALRSGNVEGLLAYARKRSAVPMCAGAAGAKGGSGLRWWRISEVENLVVCEACFEDWICATPLAHKFYMRDLTEQQSEDVWACDMAAPYIRRALMQFTARGAWLEFVEACRYSLALPSCTKDAVERGSRRWYRPAKPWRIEHMMICEACYLNTFGKQLFASNFEQVNTLPLEKTQDRICDFQRSSIQSCTEALLEQDYYLWHILTSEIVSKPDCARGAIADAAEWYILPNPLDRKKEIPEFDICAACYAGHFKATNLEYVLRSTRYPAGVERVCDFSATSARAQQYLRLWRHAAHFTGDPKEFIGFVRCMSL